MNVTLATWVITIVAVTTILVADLVVVSRRPHKPSVREATGWVLFYIALAIGFGMLVWAVWGAQYGGEFYAGWLTEYSLSIDNLFVFAIIFARFAVPAHLQQTVLVIGIMLALVLRGIFIAVGAAVISAFSDVFYLFGVFLVVTAWRLAHESDQEEEFHENRLIGYVGRVLPSTPEYHGLKLRVNIDGRRLWTPMVVVMIAIGTTDVLFAVDSIPAIFGLTQEPYLVFTANAFALMGLMQLFFVLGGLLDRLRYLSKGLAVVLGFIGVKLILEALAHNSLPFINGGQPVEGVPAIPVWLSLGVIIVVLAITAVLSLLADHRDRQRAVGP